MNSSKSIGLTLIEENSDLEKELKFKHFLLTTYRSHSANKAGKEICRDLAIKLLARYSIVFIEQGYRNVEAMYEIGDKTRNILFGLDSEIENWCNEIAGNVEGIPS
jgi:hypothetical protein